MKRKKNRQIHNYSQRLGNTTLLAIDRTARQKVSKDTEELNNTINQEDLIAMYITPH